MSYCVNCGVELADSEKRCPLCHVEVVNPQKPWEESPERPYSRHVDTIMKRIDRSYLATLMGLILTIPCVITVLLDILSGDGLSWSAYVVGAITVLFVCALLPLYFKRYHTVLFLSADCAAVLLYLLFIERMNGGSWFLGLGLPLTAAASVCILVPALLFTKLKPSVLIRIGIVLFAVGLYVVATELVISLNDSGMVRLVWSWYALIPCAVLGVVAMVLERRKKLKESIRRRLFY